MATFPPFVPAIALRNGLMMTLYSAWRAHQIWETTLSLSQPPYFDHIFSGADGVPLFAWVAPIGAATHSLKDNLIDNSKGTIIGTYGITGTLENQWFLQILGRKAYAEGYGVVLFDWRAHGRSAQLSPALTSDGLYEGEDFVRIAAQAKALGCKPPFWFVGYSLGGQLALWGLKAAQSHRQWGADLNLADGDIGGGAVICPSLDSDRSLRYLMRHPLGRSVEKAIAKTLQQLAYQLYDAHPQAFDLAAIARANSIRGFDQELVIEKLGFATTQAYYQASSPLPFLPQLQKPTLIIYAQDDPLFDPAIMPDLEVACRANSDIDLVFTKYGGHVGYISSCKGQALAGDSDRWWAWNRVLDWLKQKAQKHSSKSIS
jgi:hypothetical protein